MCVLATLYLPMTMMIVVASLDGDSMKKYLVVRQTLSTFETEDSDWEDGEEPSPERALEIAKQWAHKSEEWFEEEVSYSVDEV